MTLRRILPGARKFAAGLRNRIAKEMAGLGDAPAILMYHRVARVDHDPWGLAVSPENFESQARALAGSRTILAMDEFVAALDAGTLPDRATALTFDDGYTDNAVIAAPILARLGLPATIFVTTDASQSGQPLWWDELCRLVMATRGETRLQLTFGGMTLNESWSDSTQSKLAAYMRLWAIVRDAGPAMRPSLMARLSEVLDSKDRGTTGQDELAAPLSPSMIREVANGAISIGAHGVDHTPLTSLDHECRLQQIESSGRIISEWIGKRVSGFAYPHGDWDGATRDMVRGCSYDWAVTTRHGLVDTRKPDRFALPRIMVPDCDGHQLLALIRRAPLA